MQDPPQVARLQRSLTVSWLVVIGLATFLLVPVARRWFADAPNGDPRPITPRGELADFETTTVELFQSASPSVVYVTTKVVRPWQRRIYEVESGTGSGFVWDKHGHIVTNYHVIKNADLYQVVFSDHTAYEAKLVNFSADDDLAVLKVDAPAELLHPVLVGESDNLVVGQSVFAIGNPFGLDQTLTTGIVSALSRPIEAPSGRTIDDVIQIDAAINPGNSGGPLLDSAGRLIGVNTAIYSPSGASAGIGFAIPVDTVNRVVPSIIATKRYEPPRLGIHVDRSYNRLAASQLGIQGIVITALEDGGPAQAAGLRGITQGTQGTIVLGDVILSVGEQRVTTLNELLTALERHKRGEIVELTILREGEQAKVSVTLK